MIEQKHRLKFRDKPVTDAEDEIIRSLANKNQILYLLAKEQYFENKTGLNKWNR